MPSDTSTEKFSKTDLYHLTICCLGQFLVVLEASIVNVSLPTLRNSLNFCGSQLQWVVNSYTILFATLLLIGGILADAFGGKKMLIIGGSVFGLASLLAGFSASPLTLILWRTLQGTAAGIIAPSTLSIIAIRFGQNPSLRGKAFGLWGAVASAGGAAGVLFGGIIAEWMSWQWVFWVNVPVTVLLIILSIKMKTNEAGKAENKILAFKGISLSALGAASLFIIIVAALEFSKPGLSPLIGFLGLILGICIAVLFWKLQKNLEHPIIPPEFAKMGSVVKGNISALVSSGSIFATYYFLTLLFRDSLGYSAMSTGLAYLPMTIAMFYSARTAGSKLSQKYGSGVTNIIGLFIAGIGLMIVALGTGNQAQYLPWIAIGTLVLGAGQGIITTSSSMLATEGVNWQKAGTASALVNASRQIGGALILGILVSISLLVAPMGQDDAHMLSLIFAALLPILLAIIFFTETIMKVRRKTQDYDVG